MHKPITTLLQKDMTRKEFFQVLGYGIIAMAGIGTILQLLGKDARPAALKEEQSGGYGMSAYGR